jgi:hypothetical protein
MANVTTPKRHTQRSALEYLASKDPNLIFEFSSRVAEDLSKFWWLPTNPNSLRLSPHGRNAISSKCWRFSIRHWSEDHNRWIGLTNKNLLTIERKFPGIYYLESPTADYIEIFEEEDATFLTLLGGDIYQFLAILDQNK